MVVSFLTLFIVSSVAGFNCSVDNIIVDPGANSATISWDTTPDCDKVILTACHHRLYDDNDFWFPRWILSSSM